MFIEQIIKFESRSPGPRGCTCNPKTGNFYDKTIIAKKNLRVNLAAKLIAEGNVPCFPSPGPLHKIYPKNARFYP